MKAKWINAFEEDEALTLHSETAEEEKALDFIHDNPELLVVWYHDWKRQG